MKAEFRDRLFVRWDLPASQKKKGGRTMRKRYFAVAAGCLMVLLVVAQAFACTTIIVGKKVSPTGYVIVGHNEDDGGRLTVRHGFVPAREFKEGAVLPAEEGRAAIPQVPKTFAL